MNKKQQSSKKEEKRKKSRIFFDSLLITPIILGIIFFIGVYMFPDPTFIDIIIDIILIIALVCIFLFHISMLCIARGKDWLIVFFFGIIGSLYFYFSKHRKYLKYGEDWIKKSIEQNIKAKKETERLKKYLSK